jgi:peptidoglycan/LPS O-acetylase OafA/YrhL
LRAIAALSVVANHAANRPTGVTHGWVGNVASQLNSGVTIFFLISGFLLYRPFIAARQNGLRPPRARDFARRRILRIVPAYWLALVVVSAWLGVAGPFGRHWWIYFGFLQTYDAKTAFSGLSVAWSLSTEMTFYVLLPLYAIALARLAKRPYAFRAETSILAGLCLVTLAFDHVEPHIGSYKYTYTIAGTFDWFALGMFLALASVVVERRTTMPLLVRLVQKLPELCWLAAAAAFSLDVAIWTYHPIFIGTHLLFGATAFFLLLPAVFQEDPGARRGFPRWLLGTRLLAWLGLVSYGIYLWHTPLMTKLAPSLTNNGTSASSFFILAAAGGVTAVVVAAASYYLVEQWFLRLKDFRRTTRPRAAD